MYYSIFFCQIAILISSGICRMCSEISDSEERLKCDILKDYSEVIAPINGTNELVVSVVIHPMQIEVDETESTVTIDVWFNLTWEDKKLKWNPEKYGGLQISNLDCSRIWAPSFLSATHRGYVLEKSTSNLDCIVQWNGQVSSVGVEKLNALNNYADYTLWPYDKQYFVVGLHNKKSSNQNDLIKYKYKEISNQTLIKDNKWELEKFLHWLSYDSSRVKMEVFLTRHHSVHTYTYIYPSYVLTLMIVSTIWLNILSPERLLISGLLFLTQNIYLEYFMFILPTPTSTAPYIARFHKYLLLINGSMIVWTIITRVIGDMTYENHLIIVFVKWVRTKPYLKFFLIDSEVPQSDAMENDGLDTLHHLSLMAKKKEQLNICLQFADRVVCLTCSFLVVILMIAYRPVI